MIRHAQVVAVAWRGVRGETGPARRTFFVHLWGDPHAHVQFGNATYEARGYAASPAGRDPNRALGPTATRLMESGRS